MGVRDVMHLPSASALAAASSKQQLAASSLQLVQSVLHDTRFASKCAGHEQGKEAVRGRCAWWVQERRVADAYRDKYKGISLALSMLSRALNGSYVNFGVFELYQDPALDNALSAAMSMALAIPCKDVIAYAKVAKAYFVFMEAVCHNHTAYFVRQPQQPFSALVGCLGRGLVGVDTQVSSQCAMAVDNLATWLHKNMMAEPNKVHPATEVRGWSWLRGVHACCKRVRQDKLDLSWCWMASSCTC